MAPGTKRSQPKAGARPGPGASAKRAIAPSRLIEKRIRSLGGWRAKILEEVRRLIHEADPEIIEECKWVKPSNPLGVPVWSHAGIVCTGEAYRQVVKLTFARGAALSDPRGLFNSSLEGNTRRSIDIREGESLHAAAFKTLIRVAVQENLRSSAGKTRLRRRAGSLAEPSASTARPVKLLAGGNPRVAKAEGDAPVQAYIAAMPGWKRDVGSRLDALIVRNAPDVRKAVKWNSPFYGIEDQGWFVSFHVFTNYVKVTFFCGTSLRPPPPGGKGKDARWIDVHEDDFDETRMASWVKQAAAIPGWVP